MRAPCAVSAAPVESGAVRRGKPGPVRPDWISKTLAGLLLGLSLAIICSGLLAAWLAGMPLAVSGQLAMWLVPPAWLERAAREVAQILRRLIVSR